MSSWNFWISKSNFNFIGSRFNFDSPSIFLATNCSFNFTITPLRLLNLIIFCTLSGANNIKLSNKEFPLAVLDLAAAVASFSQPYSSPFLSPKTPPFSWIHPSIGSLPKEILTASGPAWGFLEASSQTLEVSLSPQ